MSFQFPGSAHKSYVYTIMKSIKCATASCLNMYILQKMNKRSLLHIPHWDSGSQPDNLPTDGRLPLFGNYEPKGMI